MNVYDPADHIVYLVLAAGDGPPVASPTETPLPRGYANESPRTSLRSRGTAVRGGGASAVAVLTPRRTAIGG